MNAMPGFCFPQAPKMTLTHLTQRKRTLMPYHISLLARPDFRSLTRRPLGTVLTILALSLVPGCGSGVGDVSGKVYYKGKIVTSGFVTMIGRDGIPKNSEIAEDGSYQIASVPIGEVKIAVSSPPLDPTKAKGKQPPRRPGDEGRKANPGPEATETQKKTWREIDIIYTDVTKNNLRYTVTSGANSHDIKLD
jgi:hypothetical protein